MAHPTSRSLPATRAADGYNEALFSTARLERSRSAARSGRSSQVRQYDAPGKPELTFSTSVERAQDIQPVAIQVTLGQGEPPVSAAERDRAYKKDKVWARVFGLLFLLGFW